MKKSFLIGKSMKIKLKVIPFLLFFVLVAVGCENEHIAKGHKNFNRYCSACHGNAGDGNGYNAVNLDPAPRDLTDSQEEYMGKLSNDEVYEVLDVGGYGVDLAGTMPVWGTLFSEEDLWSIVAYIRTLHPNDEAEIVFTKPDSKEPIFDNKKPRYSRVREKVFDDLMASLVPDEDALAEQVAFGAEVFQERGCIGCHIVGGEGGTLGPNLSKVGAMLRTEFIFAWVLNPQAFVRKTRMPNLDLPHEDALAVSLYMSSLKGGDSTSEPTEDMSSDEGHDDEENDLEHKEES